MLDALAYLFVEFVLNVAFYGIGWVMLRLLTLGAYPPRNKAHKILSPPAASLSS